MLGRMFDVGFDCRKGDLVGWLYMPGIGLVCGVKVGI